MKKKANSGKPKSLISKFLDLFSKSKNHPRGNNFDLWDQDPKEDSNTKEKILKGKNRR